MLSEDEKKAIKYFYNLRATIDESYMLFVEEINVKCGKDMIKQITLVLNLITKLQKENELAKEQLKKQCEIAAERNNLLVKVNRLESQIDLMAEYIATLDIEEDICKNIKKDNCDKMNFGECEHCIKQYFERKCEE